MEITNVRTSETETTISVLADCKIRPVGRDTVYFTFDKKYKDFIYADASPFAAALMIPSMKLGQDLIIKGSISEKLYEGMHQIMDIMLSWEIGLKRIKIKADKIVKDDIHPKNVACFFSAGVDSFYTYLKHSKDTEDKISHLIVVKGSDIDLRNKRLWQMAKENIYAVAEKGGVDVIPVESNVQIVLEPIITPDYAHGGCLAAVGLCLRRGFKKVYIGATFKLGFGIPYGSDPRTDKLWSTEAITFEHDGAEATRLEKVEWEISRSPVALDHLRVCYMNVNGKYNCGKCEKCIRTMISLYIAGKLEDAKTLPHVLDPVEVAEIVSHVKIGAPRYHIENLATMKERNINPDLQAAIEKGLANMHPDSYSPKEAVIKKIIYIDHMYLRGKLFKVWLEVVHPFK